jgi:hypothetical protein
MRTPIHPSSIFLSRRHEAAKAMQQQQQQQH